MKLSREKRTLDTEINLTSLIDVVFLLLIFFMVTTTFERQARLRIELPEATDEPSTVQTRAIEIAISEDGRFYVNANEVINTRIGHSGRNRPPHLKRNEEEEPTSVLVESSLAQAIDQGLDPSVMAERVVNGIHDDQLYILSEEGGAWRGVCNARLDDIRLARNPTGPALALEN